MLRFRGRKGGSNLFRNETLRTISTSDRHLTEQVVLHQLSQYGDHLCG